MIDETSGIIGWPIGQQYRDMAARNEASTTTWETLVQQYRERAKLDDAWIAELAQRANHWHDTAQMLKRQRDTAEEEREGWKERAMKSEQQRQALRAEVVELRKDRDSQKLRAETAEQFRQALRAVCESFRAECEALHTTNTNLRDELVLAEGQRDQAKADAEHWKGQHALTFNLLGGLRVECESLRKDREEAMAALAFTGETSLWQAASAANQEVGHLKAERDALRKGLLDLLAVVHRDGGHHTEAVGTRQSVVDAELAVHALRKDAARLDWLSHEPVFEGFADSPLDVFELESIVAEQNGRSEPTQADRREAFRRIIDTAMAVQPTTGEGA